MQAMICPRLILNALVILFVVPSSSLGQVSSNKNIPTVITNELKREQFKLRNGESISLEIYSDFNVLKIYEGHDRYITAFPCVSAETYKRVVNKTANEVEKILNSNVNEITFDSVICMRDLLNVDVGNLKIEFRNIEIINH